MYNVQVIVYMYLLALLLLEHKLCLYLYKLSAAGLFIFWNVIVYIRYLLQHQISESNSIVPRSFYLELEHESWQSPSALFSIVWPVIMLYFSMRSSKHCLPNLDNLNHMASPSQPNHTTSTIKQV